MSDAIDTCVEDLKSLTSGNPTYLSKKSQNNLKRWMSIFSTNLEQAIHAEKIVTSSDRRKIMNNEQLDSYIFSIKMQDKHLDSFHQTHLLYLGDDGSIMSKLFFLA